MLDEEILAEALEGFLHTFMSGGVGELEERGQHRGRGEHEHTGAVEDEAVHDAPRGAPLGDHRVAEGMEVSVVLQFMTEILKSLKEGLVSALRCATSSSCLVRASATMLRRLGRYSTAKS